MVKEMCDVTVTWLNGNTQNCRISTKHFSDKDWIVLIREYDHDYVIDVSSIRYLSPEKENPKFLRINTGINLLDISFADSRQAAAWQKEINDLKANVKTAEKNQEVQPRQPEKVSAQMTADDKIEIPLQLRWDVKLAIGETAALGPVGSFSSIADIASIAGWWGYLLVRYAQYYGAALDRVSSEKICSSALLGMGGYYFGCKTATKLFHLIPGAGSIVAMGVSSMTNIIFTYRFAITLTRIFSKGSVDYAALSDSIKCMFAGTAMGFQSVKDIVNLYLHY